MHWPFQSVATVETSLLSQIAEQPFPFRPFSNGRDRRATWQPKRLLPRSRGSDSDTINGARELIPDYVVNYMRGETPETVARRKRNAGNLGERVVDVVTPSGHRPHQSRAAEFEGFFDDASINHDDARHSGDGGDEERILGGCVEKRPQSSGSSWKKLLDGWRGGIALNVLLAFLILLAGFVCLVYAAGKELLSAGESVIFTGSCAAAQGIDTGLHVLMNMFAVALLAGGNYVFQILSSPTRCEVNIAHGKKKWLDIGIPSLRNLVHIARSRAVLACMVLLVAIVTQVM